MTAHIGIVGHERAKFTAGGEAEARRIIRRLLDSPDAVLVSGGCHLGGVDIWAEEIADQLGCAKIIHYPKRLTWAGGFKQRNKLIAETADIVHCLSVVKLAPTYDGMRFETCYHCHTTDHIKGGGCWTMQYAAHQLGKPTRLWRIAND